MPLSNDFLLAIALRVLWVHIVPVGICTLMGTFVWYMLIEHPAKRTSTSASRRKNRKKKGKKTKSTHSPLKQCCMCSGEIPSSDREALVCQNCLHVQCVSIWNLVKQECPLCAEEIKHL
jgi:hypothetical protein